MHEYDTAVPGWEISDLIREQVNDELWGKVKAFLRREISKMPKEIKLPADRFSLESNVLYLTSIKRGDTLYYRAVLHNSFINDSIRISHNCPLRGHRGVKATIKRAIDNFFWLGMQKTIKKFITTCHLCNCFKTHKLKVPPAKLWPSVKSKFARVHMDLVGPLFPADEGSRYICVMVDALTRFTFVYPLMNESAYEVAKALI